MYIYIYGVWFYIIQAFVQESFFRPQRLLKLAVVVQPQGITARLLHRCITWRPSSQRLLGQLPLNIFNTTSTSGSRNKLYIQGPRNLLGYFGFKNRYVSLWQMCFFYIPSPFSHNSLQQPCWENVSEGQHDWQRVSSGLPATNHLSLGCGFGGGIKCEACTGEPACHTTYSSLLKVDTKLITGNFINTIHQTPGCFFKLRIGQTKHRIHSELRLFQPVLFVNTCPTVGQGMGA